MTASQLAPAKNVEPIRVDHPEFWQTLAAWESEGDCASMVHLHGQLDALVEELAPPTTGPPSGTLYTMPRKCWRTS